MPRRKNLDLQRRLTSAPNDALEEGRQEWIQKRQTELEQLTERHDEMVHELFHMSKFGLMLEYDRATAKDDSSLVFTTFASQYNLLRNAPAGVVPRRTRKSQADFFTSLSTSPQKPQLSASPRRPVDHVSLHIISRAEGSPENPRPTKKKRVEEPPTSTSNLQDDGSISLVPRRVSTIVSSASPQGTPAPGRPQRAHHPPRRYRGNDEPINRTDSHPLPVAQHSRGKRTPARSASPPPSESPLSPSTLSPSPPPDFSMIKRVKLIVRPPPPLVSNPEQRPGRRLYNGNLNALLESFVILDEDALTSQDVQRMVQEEASVREKGRDMQARGLLRPSFLSEQDDGDDFPYSSTPHDTWTAVVASVVEQHSARSAALSSEKACQHVASLVFAHSQESENEALAQERAEERRLVRLAKTVANLVIVEWRKAVFHVREEQRLQEQEEERQRGQKHLDAMLDQSGQILEAQQTALTRAGGARSTSVRSLSDAGDSSSSPSESGDSTEDGDGEELVDVGLSSLLDLSAVPITIRRRRQHRYSRGISSNRSSSVGRQSSTSSPRISTRSLDLDHEDLAHEDLGLLQVGISLAVPALSSSSSTTSHNSTPPPELPDARMIDDDETVHSPINKLSSMDQDPQSVTNDYREAGVVEPQLPMSSAEHLSSPDIPLFNVRQDMESQEDTVPLPEIPAHLRPYATAAVRWDERSKVASPFLLRGHLRPYQHAGLEWLISLHNGMTNGILADEMGLGKTIQTIALLAHLACDRGIWGPHLIIVPTSVILNWAMEFKKFLPGFRIVAYHGTAVRRKELRKGWNSKDTFNVCITSYTLATRDYHVFKRRAWYYMILDEAHMIKNFKSQRWNTLLGFNSFRRLLLTGTPLQNNLTELWSLLQFLMSGTTFANRKEFSDWFSSPLEKAVEMGVASADENQARVSKLHSLLRPHLLRRLKQDVEKELPRKYEHLVFCPLSKRQRTLYDEFMNRKTTAEDLGSGMYYRIANILMQLRKVCNHPDLFEVRPIVTSFAMSHSAVSGFEIKELLIRRRLLFQNDELSLPSLPGLRFVDTLNTSVFAHVESNRVEDITSLVTPLGSPVIKDTRTVSGFKAYRAYEARSRALIRRMDTDRMNRLRCSASPSILSAEAIVCIRSMVRPLVPLSEMDQRLHYLSTSAIAHSMVLSHPERAIQMDKAIDRFACVTPSAIAVDLPRLALAGSEEALHSLNEQHPNLLQLLHRPSVKLQIAFPDSSLLQYDCGKLQELHRLLRERKAGGHRVLLFTQMTKVLDIVESFLNLHGYLYLRLDGSTKIEDRQYITERFNSDSRIFCFISSSRSGGVGINLTGADTVVFYDSDFNPQMDRQCEDRAHRIGQIRDVHIYRFVSKYTVEEALLRKANQKRSLDDLVIQQGEFDWRTVFRDHDTRALDEALGAMDDADDAQAARLAAREASEVEGADDADFRQEEVGGVITDGLVEPSQVPPVDNDGEQGLLDCADEEEDGGTIVEYMLRYVVRDSERDHFDEWLV